MDCGDFRLSDRQAEQTACEAAAIAKLADARGLLAESNQIALGWLMLLSHVGAVAAEGKATGR